MTDSKCLVREEIETDARRELEILKVQLQLVRAQVDKSLEHGSAIGGEVTLALRIQAILEYRL